MTDKREIICELQNYIERPHTPARNLYQQSCSSDQATVAHWADIWLRQIKANHDTYGSFRDHAVGHLFNSRKGLPAILAGSGPSLVRNAHQLNDRGTAVLVSCLHNYHFFEDRDIDVDYYVTLDAGPITIKEIAEGGDHDLAWYLERSKTKTLIAFVGTHPDLLAAWKGKVYFYSCAIPALQLMERIDQIERFNQFFATGGNVLGASMYFAKAILGCPTLAFVGADFSFGYEHRFHGWASSYDATMGQTIRVPDIYGNSVRTWPSYYGFKCWFDWVTMTVPGVYINCTEGGIFGAHKEGNLMSVMQMPLEKFLTMLNVGNMIIDQINNPDASERRILW